jgi:hypothetical protein
LQAGRNQFATLNINKPMKINFLLFVSSFLLLVSCNKDEGVGGSSSLEGYVYQVDHSTNNFSFRADTFPSIDERIFLIYGNDYEDYYGKDPRTDKNGLYRIDYLREGNYIVYSLSESEDKQKKAAFTNVKVKGHLTKADTIFIHTGKAAETAQVGGLVWVKYYNKGYPVKVNGQDSIPALETRVFIKNVGENAPFDDVRVSDTGNFIFQKISPHKAYEVYVSTEIPGESYKKILLPKSQTVQVGESYQTYPLAGEGKLEFTIIINN